MKVPKTILFTTMMAALSSSPASAQNKEAIELSKLIEAFLVSPGTSPEWSMGAGKSTDQIKWTSVGTEGKPDCGIYSACRKGTVRVLLNGKEMQHLRQRLEPIKWNLFMSSRSPARFGPEEIDISPSCDTVQCSFDFKNAVMNKGLVLAELCKAGPASSRQTAYEVRNGTKFTYLIVNENLASGGASTSLTLHFKRPDDSRLLCAGADSVKRG